MSEKPYRIAVFQGLVFNEAEEPAEVVYIGPDAHYVILDDGFKRHVEAKIVDRQVISWLQEQISANQDQVTEGMMDMLGKDDLFTKAMIDSSIKNVDQMMETGIPDDAKMWLGMMGFKIVVDVHGEIVSLDMPVQEDFEE
jgi:hypothetical protein